MKHKTKQKLKLNHKAGLNCEAGLLLYPDSPPSMAEVET